MKLDISVFIPSNGLVIRQTISIKICSLKVFRPLFSISCQQSIKLKVSDATIYFCITGRVLLSPVSPGKSLLWAIHLPTPPRPYKINTETLPAPFPSTPDNKCLLKHMLHKSLNQSQTNQKDPDIQGIKV